MDNQDKLFCPFCTKELECKQYNVERKIEIYECGEDKNHSFEVQKDKWGRVISIQPKG